MTWVLLVVPRGRYRPVVTLADPPPSSRALLRGLFVRVLIANLLAAVFVAGYLALVESVPAGESRAAGLVWGGVSLVALVLVLGAFAYWQAVRMAFKDWRWVDDGRGPDEEEQRVVLSAPVRLGLRPLPYWAVIALAGSVVRVTYGPVGSRPLVPFVVTILGGLVGCGISYFLVERHLRPLTAVVLHGELPHAPRALTLRGRLMLGWALGSGIPLVGIIATPVLREPGADIPMAVPMVFLAIAGLIGGAVLSRAAGVSIAEPIDEVRDGLREVARGELEVSVSVDEVGDIGLMQAGFNQMVRALSERQRVQELFGQHVGHEVARNALERGVDLGGELREVSVFFVDLVSSTELAQEMDPSALVDLLNALFDAVVKAVAAEEGWVNKFEGDAALCVFGAPGEQPDHALRALRAARDLRRRIAMLHRDHPDLDAGIGIATGKAVAGNVGAADRFEYTVIGVPVNLAARLTESAKQCDGRVLALADSVESAGDAGAGGEARHWRPAGSVSLRGVRDPVPVCEPVA